MTASADARPVSSVEPAAVQRIDKWIWCARFVKTRTAASKLVASNGVRLTRDGETSRITKASALVRIGDKLAFMIGDRVRVVEVAGIGLRRGPASEATALYMDHSPPPPTRARLETKPENRAKGAGRPTKKERRATDRFKSDRQE